MRFIAPNFINKRQHTISIIQLGCFRRERSIQMGCFVINDHSSCTLCTCTFTEYNNGCSQINKNHIRDPHFFRDYNCGCSPVATISQGWVYHKNCRSFLISSRWLIFLNYLIDHFLCKWSHMKQFDWITILFDLYFHFLSVTRINCKILRNKSLFWKRPAADTKMNVFPLRRLNSN